jgi:ABC-type uncharacterized transport system involved in gliding motility auxiliary subunit
MKRKSWFKWLKYLVWLGPMLIIAGLSAGVVSGTWAPVPIALIWAGVLILILGLFALTWGGDPSQPGFWQRRSTEAGTNAVVALVAMLAILGLINFLGVRYGQRLDLTENQQFTLAPQTQELVRSLKQPVRVLVFDKQPNPQDQALLENYRRQGKQFSFAYVDPQAEPTLAKQLDVKNFGDVVLESQPNPSQSNPPQSNQRKQFVQAVNAQERLSEVKLTNAIEQILSDRRTLVYLLQGHGERPMDAGKGAISQAVKLLGEKNFTVKPLNLAESKEFPQDANLVIVAGPQKTLLEPEVKALKDYLQKGGNLVLLLDPTNADLKLDPLLQDWGVTLDKRVAIDASGSGKLINLGPADAIVTQYGDHPITKELQGTLSFFSLARPLDIKPIPDVKSTPLLFTSNNSWAESNLQADPLQFDSPNDLQGPLVLGAALTRPVAKSPEPKSSPSPQSSPPSLSPQSPSPSPSFSASPSPSPEANKEPGRESRLIVIGNSTFATDGLFDQLGNGDVFLNSVRWAGQQEQSTLSIRPKEAKNRRINLTAQQASLAGWLALVILPLLAFGTAIFIWWRRR